MIGAGRGTLVVDCVSDVLLVVVLVDVVAVIAEPPAVANTVPLEVAATANRARTTASAADQARRPRRDGISIAWGGYVPRPRPARGAEASAAICGAARRAAAGRASQAPA